MIFMGSIYPYIDDLVQDCSISSALAMEMRQSYTKPSMWQRHFHITVTS